MLVSVIMPSLLSEYEWWATHKISKFHRAVHSFLQQDTNNWFFSKELIISSDGCEITNALFNTYYSKFDNIFLVSNDKKWNFYWNIRQRAIELSKWNVITFLDTDDYIWKWHLYNIVLWIKSYDWVYWDDYLYTDDWIILRKTSLEKWKCGTSTIAYKKWLNVSWKKYNWYWHDYSFISNELLLYKNNSKISNTFYLCCHIPWLIDK